MQKHFETLRPLLLLGQSPNNKKRQLPAMGNWRNKNDYDSSVLVGMIIPIGNHTSPKEGQGFF